MIMSSIRDGLLLRRLGLVLIASFAVLAFAGCGIFSPDESDVGDDIIPPVDFKPAIVDTSLPDDGRGQLITNLELAYVEMNYEEYEKLINTDYVFRVDPADIDVVGSAEMSAAPDLESTFAMFSGETGLERIFDDDGNFLREDPVPAVQTIRLDLNPESASSWTLMDTGEFVGTWRLIYDVDMTVFYSGASERTDTIIGKQVFYAVATTVIEGGIEFQVWELRAWEDQGING